MQAAYLISAKAYTEKQVGTLFFMFGISQFLCMAPSGYFLDYSSQKIKWVIWAGGATAALTVITAMTALPFGENMLLQIVLHMIQGGISSILPIGFNGITLGIVGGTGFTHQVSRNRMMNHVGTALVVAIGSLIAYTIFPNIGHLFIVSPVAAVGFWYNLSRIKPDHVNKDAARGLIVTSPTMTEYEEMDDQNAALWIATANSRADGENDDDDNDPCMACSSSPTYIPPDLLDEQQRKTESFKEEETPKGQQGSFVTANLRTCDSGHSGPSFRFGWSSNGTRRAQTPLAAFMDIPLLVFSFIVFFFHLSNSSVLPLVMQSLALSDPQAGILLSGLCILIAQVFMAFFAKICGDYSPIWGRKGLTLVALFSLSIRCFLLTFLTSVQESQEEDEEEGGNGTTFIKMMILSTQFLDSIGAGLFGTLHILVTNDISGGTGRFSLMMGVTTGAMCLGGTVSGYLGQSLAQDYGYPAAFSALGMLSLVPFLTYLFFMPETLPAYARPKPRRRRLQELLLKIKTQGIPNVFARRKEEQFNPVMVKPNVELV